MVTKWASDGGWGGGGKSWHSLLEGSEHVPQ